MFSSPYLQPKWLLRWVVIAVVLFGLIQLIPFGRTHSDPPVVQEPAWNSPQTRQLAVEACYACHSNQTQWPWYSNVAPVSWFTELDVLFGRHRLNFSDWTANQMSTSRIVGSIQSGKMPPIWYTPMHPKSRLTAAQRQALIQGLEATLGATGNHH